MSNDINDSGAVKFPVGIMPVTMLDMFRQCAQTSQFTADAGAKSMSSALLYPFYGGKAVPDTVMHTDDYWGLSTVTIHRNAAQIGFGQSVVVIANALPSGIKITRPCRDGGWMFGVPQDAGGTDNHIPGKTTLNGADYFGVGAYGNDTASIFYGSGAVLLLTPDDGTLPSTALAYGSSINGGCGLGITANASSMGDAKNWFSKTADHDNFTPGANLSDTNGHVKITASVSPWDRLDSNTGGLFTVLLEHV